jgi:hypothetical protein
MRFEELSKEHQEFLMYCLSDYIKGKIKKRTMDGIIFPNYEEYKDFFNEFDEGYEIVDGLPESEAANPFSVKFKVVLEADK